MRVGIDTVEIERIKKSLEIKGFKERVYSAEELEFINNKAQPAQTLAANFAAKEAFAKALGTGVRGFWLDEVSVLRDELGAPYLKLSNRAKEIAKGYAFTVSLTHTQTDATAIVIAYEV